MPRQVWVRKTQGPRTCHVPWWAVRCCMRHVHHVAPSRPQAARVVQSQAEGQGCWGSSTCEHVLAGSIPVQQLPPQVEIEGAACVWIPTRRRPTSGLLPTATGLTGLVKRRERRCDLINSSSCMSTCMSSHPMRGKSAGSWIKRYEIRMHPPDGLRSHCSSIVIQRRKSKARGAESAALPSVRHDLAETKQSKGRKISGKAGSGRCWK